MGLRIEETSPEWSPDESGKLQQMSLWSGSEVRQLEKIPYKFKYRYRCPHDDCGEHEQSCTDWEMSQSYRKWRRTYGNDWESYFRLRYEQEMIERFDTCFFAGTMHQHPNSWLVVGLWYPPKVPGASDTTGQLQLL